MARRSKGDGSVYQRAHDGRWVAAVTLPDGRRRVRYATTKKLADAQRRLMLRELEDHGSIPERITLAQWLDQWLADVESAERLRPSTLAGYRSKVRLYVVPRIGHRRLADLRPDDLRGLYAGMRGRGLSQSTVRQTHAIIRRALVVAVREGHLRSNPAALMDGPVVRRERRPLALSVEDALRLVQHVRGGRDEPRVWLALLGLRQGEALGLSWRDVDLERGLLHVTQALQRVKGKGLVLVPPKSATSRRPLAMPPQLVDVFRAHADRQSDLREAALDLWGNDKRRLVLTTPTGQPIDPHDDWERWKALCKAADVPATRVHDARHTAAHLLLAFGVPMQDVRAWMGHASVDLTLTTYGHVGDDGLPSVAATFDRVLGVAP